MRITAPMKQFLQNRSTVYGFWLSLILVCVVLQWAGLEPALRYDRQLIAEGQWWLLFTGHLVHLGWNHLWLNMAGVLLMVIFFSRYGSLLEWLSVLVLAMMVTGLALYGLNTDLIWYVGLSGVLHGFFVVAGTYEFRAYPKSGVLVLLVVVTKLVWEQFYGALPGSAGMAGGEVMVDAHLYGALAGGLFLLLHQLVHVDDRQQDGEHDH